MAIELLVSIDKSETDCTLHHPLCVENALLGGNLCAMALMGTAGQPGLQAQQHWRRM